MSRFYVQASEYELIASLDVTADDVSDAISRFNQHFKGRVDGWKDVKSSTHLVINLDSPKEHWLGTDSFKRICTGWREGREYWSGSHPVQY